MDREQPTRRIYPIVFRRNICVGEGSITSGSSIKESLSVGSFRDSFGQSWVTGRVQEEDFAFMNLKYTDLIVKLIKLLF